MKTREELQEEFKKEVDNRSNEIDPNDEQDWYSLTLGWAIAKGLSPKKAHDFAVYIRYSTNLG